MSGPILHPGTTQGGTSRIAISKGVYKATELNGNASPYNATELAFQFTKFSSFVSLFTRLYASDRQSVASRIIRFEAALADSGGSDMMIPTLYAF